MSKANARAQFYMMLGAAGVAVVVPPPPVDHTCDPYTRVPYNAANITLSELVVTVSNTAANITLCEVII